MSVVLGTASEPARATESQKLVNYGFQFYDTVRLYEKAQAVSTVRVWKGSANTIKAGFLSDLYLSVPKGNADRLKAKVESQQPLLAPIAAGQPVGVLHVEMDGKPYGDFPIVALEDAPLAGLFGRGWDSLRLLLK